VKKPRGSIVRELLFWSLVAITVAVVLILLSERFLPATF
jgi:hypothetical protein